MGCNCNKTTATKAAKGAVKLVAAELGIGLASTDVIEARRRTCEGCPEWDHGKCLSCGCYTWAKTRLAKETCPIGNW